MLLTLEMFFFCEEIPLRKFGHYLAFTESACVVRCNQEDSCGIFKVESCFVWSDFDFFRVNVTFVKTQRNYRPQWMS